MSVIKARIVNRHGYFLEVQNNGTITSSVQGDDLNGILEFKTVDFGKITIQGVHSGFYIHTKSDGSLTASKMNNTNVNSLTWEEDKPRGKYTSFLSISTGGFLSIRKNGNARAVKKTITELGRSELWAFQPV